MQLTKSDSIRTLCELPENQPVIDLTDCSTVLEFANSIKKLTINRRQTIWVQNVRTDDTTPQSQTTDPHQIHGILLFLVIIFAKEKFPSEGDLLISKLNVFVTSSPFIKLKTYIQSKHFPILQDQFVKNDAYFASMIEDYATHTLRPRFDSRATSAPLTLAPPSTALNTTPKEDAFYARLEQKIVELFGQRLTKIEYKMNTLSKEIQLMKYAMIEEAKLDDDTEKVEDLITEIQVIKRDIAQITRTQSDRTLLSDTKLKNKSRKRSKSNPKRSSKSDITLIESENPSKFEMETVISELEMDDETGADVEKRKEDLREWLDSECGLSEYLDMFVSNGLDDLSMMPHITMTDLTWLGVETLGHRVKIMQKVQQLKCEKQRQYTYI